MAIPLLTETLVAVGDLYDTGREYLENHRFRKCECHDARNVRTPATAISTLRDQNPVVVPTRREMELSTERETTSPDSDPTTESNRYMYG